MAALNIMRAVDDSRPRPAAGEEEGTTGIFPGDLEISSSIAGVRTTTAAAVTEERPEIGRGQLLTRGGGTIPPKRSPGYRRASKSKGMKCM